MKTEVFSDIDNLFFDVEKKVPLSTRVKEETKSILEIESSKKNTNVSALAAAILDQYVKWIKSNGKTKE